VSRLHLRQAEISLEWERVTDTGGARNGGHQSRSLLCAQGPSRRTAPVLIEVLAIMEILAIVEDGGMMTRAP
jgi:hypothetical protein